MMTQNSTFLSPSITRVVLLITAPAVTGLLMRKSSSCTEENSKLLSLHPHTALQVLTCNGKLSLQEGESVPNQQHNAFLWMCMCAKASAKSHFYVLPLLQVLISELAWNVNFLQSLNPPTHSPRTAPRNVLFPFTSQLLCVCACVCVRVRGIDKRPA